MNDPAHADLQRALQITIDMLHAAAGSNWDRVLQLEAERQRQLRKRQPGRLSETDRQIISTIVKHNLTLMAHADAARSTLKEQIDQQQYNHRALRTYISCSVTP
jgi:transposase